MGRMRCFHSQRIHNIYYTYNTPLRSALSARRVAVAYGHRMRNRAYTRGVLRVCARPCVYYVSMRAPNPCSEDYARQSVRCHAMPLYTRPLSTALAGWRLDTALKCRDARTACYTKRVREWVHECARVRLMFSFWQRAHGHTQTHTLRKHVRESMQMRARTANGTERNVHVR